MDYLYNTKDNINENELLDWAKERFIGKTVSSVKMAGDCLTIYFVDCLEELRIFARGQNSLKLTWHNDNPTKEQLAEVRKLA